MNQSAASGESGKCDESSFKDRKRPQVRTGVGQTVNEKDS